MKARFLPAIGAFDAGEWNALAGNAYPFLRHEFLRVLEDSGSVGKASGWLPHHLAIHDGAHLVAAMPCYAKTHSYGEYVFDWAWADAYQRHGVRYYPKLLSAIPFTPATGPRLLIASDADRQRVLDCLLDAIRDELTHQRASSWHLLFPEQELADTLAARGLALRTGVQYHWQNPGYRDFDDFLDTLVSRKRKSLRRERRLVHEQDVQLRQLRGPDIDAAMWDHFHRFYQMTYARRSGHGGYLERDFFHALGAAMPESILLVIAEHRGKPVAGALNLIGADTLYGRYWGCTESFDQLHFETCYYQGMDFCMREGLRRFDAGAQGEHKLARGFAPVFTHSCHLIAHEGFRGAIEEFLRRERESIDAYREAAAMELPYR
jgi:predicted N-acyltransferase